MYAQIKTAVALVLALALVGAGGAAVAKSSNAVANHTSYVAMIEWIDEPAPEDEPVITGTVGCKLNLLQSAWQTFSGKDLCRVDGYAYAYPSGSPAPWDGRITVVNDSYYVDETGSIWHVAEVVYRVARDAPEGGEDLVRALASEVLPSQESLGGLDANYVLPVNPDALDAAGSPLIVGIGPAPSLVGPA